MENQVELCEKFEKAFHILGRKWNGLILESFIKHNDPVRFSDIANMVEDCSDRVLTERLKDLVNDEIIIKEKNDHKIRYQLTEKGYELGPILNLIHQWGDKWY